MSSELAPGVVVAGFEIEAFLGRGAMAEVYRARDLEGDRVVALKLLEPVAGTDERFRSRFLRESQLAAAIEHPQIVRTLASGEADGRLYLAMELIDGTDLRQLLREQGRLQPEHAVQIVSQIADALNAAHQAGLVHRDVKPGNILLDTDGNAYVCDFGLARHISSVSSLTGDRGFVGTIDYVPPEQIEGTPIDQRADIYSLGCVLYECLTGTRPYDRDSELAVVFAHLNEPPPHPTDQNPDLPSAFDTVTETALAKNPDHRYPTTTNLATAAQAALTGQILKRKQPRNRRLAAAGTITVLLAATASTATVLLTRTTTHHPLPVTVSETGIGPAKLGDSSITLTRLWNGGSKLSTQFPPDYSLLRNSSHDLSAYFQGTVDRAVELITWNANDRTQAGVGPCSTLTELKKAYGTRLKLVPNNHGYGYTVGKHLFFAIGSPPTPRFVSGIAVYSDRLNAAGFNALGEGPCTGPAAETVTAPVTTPTAKPAATPRLTQTFTSKHFLPRVTVRVPDGWTRSADGHVFIVNSADPSNAQDRVVFMLDPFASSGSGPKRPGGTVLRNVSRTPTGLVTWFRRNPYLVVTGPGTVRLGTPVLTARTIDVDLSPRAPKEDPSCPWPCISYLAFRGPGYKFPYGTALGQPARLYFALVRIGTVTHTLVIAIDSPSRHAFRQALPVTTAIVKSLRIAAVPVEELSVFGSQCSKVFGGTCLGEVPAGRHSTATFEPRLTYTVPVGWTNFGDLPGQAAFVPPGGDWRGVDAGKSDALYVFTRIAPPRGVCSDLPSTISTPAAYAHSLVRNPALATTPPEPVTLGGLSGYVLDLQLRADWKRACPFSHGSPYAQTMIGLAPSPTELAHGLIPRPMVMRLYLLAYKGGTLGIEIDAVNGPANLAAYDRVVRSFGFDGR